MSRKNLILIVVLTVLVAAAAGGIVYAQEASTSQADSLRALLADMAQEPQEPSTRNFSFFLDGGAFLGVGTEDISKENMARYGMREVRGVGVTEVQKDSPAEKAGLRKDDVILNFDGESVTSVRKLTRLVNEHSPDQTVRITVSRGGSEQELTATLAKHQMENVFGGATPRILRGGNNGAQVFPAPSWPPTITGGDEPWVFTIGGANRRIGISTQGLSKQLSDYFGVKDGGALITSVSENSPASKAGLKAGDVITAIDGEKVTSPSDISRGLSKKETGDVTLTVVRDHNTRTVTVTPEKNPNANLIQPGTIGTRRISVPSIAIPAIPSMNIQIPPIIVPATPPINVTVPAGVPRATRRTVII
ncbi:MAG TPA: PDZ domain-containing protein [Pyrinomonadaceae bacterium]|jgi:serine protease Do|nr:PDZ domain-containing protein [Pyrinomonadaceae bacterium]